MELDAHIKKHTDAVSDAVKNSGLLGVIYADCRSHCHYENDKSQFKLAEHIFSNAICFNIIWLVGSTSILLQPYPMPSLAFVKLLLLLFDIKCRQVANGVA